MMKMIMEKEEKAEKKGKKSTKEKEEERNVIWKNNFKRKKLYDGQPKRSFPQN